MKLTYVFPVTNQKYDLETFFSNFSKEKIFKNHKSWELFFVVDSTNNTCKESAYKLAKTKENIKVIELDKKFNYGSGFKACVPYITGDVTLLGDLEYPNNAQVFEQMLEKQKEGANIVHVKKQQSKVKAFFAKCAAKVYNLFVRLFTGRHDAMALTSIQLLDKLVIDVLSTLPDKSNYLRNCTGLEGVNVETVYIEQDATHYKLDYFVKTNSVVFAIVMSVIAVLGILGLVLVNTIGTKNTIILNVILIFVLLVSIAAILITLNKHVLDVRNDNLKKELKIVKSVNVK